MKISAASVRKPIFTTMVLLIVMVLGLVSLSRLRTDLLPTVELPTLTVRAEYEGASPEVMERLVTRVLEELISTVTGVEELTSVSSEGRSSIRVQFAWGTDLDVAAQDVQAMIDDEIRELPEDIPRPQVAKFDISSFPIVIVGISSGLDPIKLTQLVSRRIQPRFARIQGVANADIWGEMKPEIRIALDPRKLRAFELRLDEILTAIRDANLDLPAGTIERGHFDYILRAPAEFESLDSIRNTVVANRDGAIITIGQIAEVIDTSERQTRIVRVNGQDGIRLGIRKEADANTVEVAQLVLEEMAAVNRDYPQLDVVAVSNQGDFIERSIANVAQSVLYGGALAVLVLLFFLRRVGSTVVISLAIPAAIIATFALIYSFGYTLNLMTLGGLALGVGMMVDSSIVVIENISRRQAENNETDRQAAIAGAVEVGPAIVASTLTTLVIFLPLVFVRGVSGILFKELAMVIAFSLLASLVISLSLVPMLASKLLGGSQEANRRGPLAAVVRFSDRAFQALDNGYRDLLAMVLKARWLVLALAVGLTYVSVLLLPYLGREFMPPSDEGQVRIDGEMETGTRLQLVDDQTRYLEEVVSSAVPELEAVVTSVGASGRNPQDTSVGNLQLTLAPLSARNRSNLEVAADLRQRLEGQIPGMRIRTRAPQGQFLLERILNTEEGLSVEILGEDLETLDLLAEQVAMVLADIPGITDVDDGRQPGIPQEVITIDRNRAADLGVSVRKITSALETAVAGSRAGDYRVGSESYRILVQMKDAESLSVDQILDLTLTSERGETVALRNVVTSATGRGPVLINRKDQERVITVSANIFGRDMGSLAEEVATKLEELPRPSGYDFKLAGSYREQERAFGELIVSIILALVLVYMVLACQYESLRDPLIVMLSVPVAAIGVFATLLLTDTTLNVQSYIGCIMLGGIVVNNAILIVDQAGRLRKMDGMLTSEAVAEAGRRRLRPILMTTLTTVLGLLPLALGIGEGADAQAPLARAVMGGLAASTLITLFLIPAAYSLAHRERRLPAELPE